jgi:hypothetical protein
MHLLQCSATTNKNVTLLLMTCDINNTIFINVVSLFNCPSMHQLHLITVMTAVYSLVNVEHMVIAAHICW